MQRVKLKSSFEEILGKNNSVYSEEERKARWKEWNRLATEKGDTHITEVWNSTESCIGCIHLNEAEAWCNDAGLPCCVNPILSFKMGMVGMACMGARFVKSGQQEMEFMDNDLPF